MASTWVRWELTTGLTLARVFVALAVQPPCECGLCRGRRLCLTELTLCGEEEGPRAAEDRRFGEQPVAVGARRAPQPAGVRAGCPEGMK